MNALGIALLWCVVQVTLIGLLAGGLYLMVRRLRPAAAALVVFSGLAIVVALSLLVLSPWPRWTIYQNAPRPPAEGRTVHENSPRPLAGERRTVHERSPLPLGEGQGVRAEGGGRNDAAGQTTLGTQAVDNSRRASEQGPRIDGAEAVSVGNEPEPSAAATLWQALVDELAKPQTTAPPGAWHWPALIAMLLLATMAGGLGWLVLGVLAVRWQRMGSRPVLDGELLELVDVLRTELGCRRPIEVRQSDDLATAATIGWRRPVLLLPADWAAWTAEQRRAVLAHEIVHARSHYFIALLVGQLGLALHFYHPLLHWLIGRLRLEQELAADAAAASVSGGQKQYLMAIAELALRQQDRRLSWPARTFLPTKTTFLRRITMLRDSKLRFERLSPATRLATVGVVLACGLLVAGLRGPAGQPQAAAEDHARAVTPDDSVDTSFVIDGAALVLVMRPAAVFARPEFAEWANLLGNLPNVTPRGTRLTDFRQITVMLPESQIPSGPREVVVFQWVEPAAEAFFGKYVANREYTVKDYHGKKMYVSSHGRQVILQYDDRTAIQAGSEYALGVYLAGKRGVLPKWLPAKAWESFRHDHFVVAGDPAMMRHDIKQMLDRSPPVVEVALALLSSVWEDTTGLAVGAKLDDRLAAHAWAATKDADASERLRRTVEALRTLVQSAVRNIRTTVQSGQKPDRALMLIMLDLADRLLDNVKVQQEGSEGTLESSMALDPARLKVLLSALAAARQNAQRMQAANKMREIALAMHNYAYTYKHFPPAVLYGPDGKTPYSWRVALLPYLEQIVLYRQYHFDEPWDGPHNRKLLAQMPAVFRGWEEPADSTNSCYFVLTGPGTIFDGREGTTFAQIRDGLSNTILAVEAKRDIPWTKPEDIPYDAQKPLPKLGGYFEGGFHVAMADGSVPFLSSTASEKILRLLITKADGQPVNVEDAMPKRTAAGPGASPTGGTYTASAMLRVTMSASPIRSSIEELGRERDRLDIYKNTQKQLLLSRFVLLAALRKPELAELRSVRQATAAGDPVGWLQKQLQVDFPGRAEVMTVSFSGPDPKEAATVVNAVVNAYLKEMFGAERDKRRLRLKQLDRACAEREKELKKFAEQQAKALDKETTSSKPAISTEKRLADLKNSDPIFKEITQEREHFKADLRATPRVMLLIPAAVPEMPSRLW